MRWCNQNMYILYVDNSKKKKKKYNKKKTWVSSLVQLTERSFWSPSSPPATADYREQRNHHSKYIIISFINVTIKHPIHYIEH